MQQTTEVTTDRRPPSMEPEPGGVSGVRSVLRYDLPASLVVFLVALPLSLGIAIARTSSRPSTSASAVRRCRSAARPPV